MKNLFVVATLVGMSLTSFSAPVMNSDTCTVKYDKGKSKKKSKKAKHRCEAYKG